MMNTESTLTWEQTKSIIEQVMFTHFQEYLKDIEIDVLRGSWENLTYEEMAEAYHLSVNYLRGDIGHRLWQKLSVAIGEKVTKNNFKEALARLQTSQNKELIPLINPSFPFPEGFVALESPFYVMREEVESLCYQIIEKSGSLIRIKAPKLMGKTSLMQRVLNHAQSLNYQIIDLDLGSVNESILRNQDDLLRWLCWMVGHQANVENQLQLYWDTDILGSNDNCTVYFEDYLIPHINRPLVLGLDDVDRIFPYGDTTRDFFGMLRSWHEKGKTSSKWQQLRLVLAHSTEIYTPLDLNQSPFNAGVPVELGELGQNQIKTLARLHGLDWQDDQVIRLMQVVGGHPHLVRLALYEVSCKKMSLEKLLQNAFTEAGIYSNHLRQHLAIFQQVPELAKAFKKVVMASEFVDLDSMKIYKLHSMGLVSQLDNRVMPRCNLYREYFRRVLSE